LVFRLENIVRGTFIKSNYPHGCLLIDVWVNRKSKCTGFSKPLDFIVNTNSLKCYGIPVPLTITMELIINMIGVKNASRIAILLWFFVGLTPVYAGEDVSSERLRFDLNMGDDNNLNPDLFIPVYWRANFFSGLGFSQNSSFSSEVLAGFSDSKIGTSVNEDIVRLNILSYRTNNVDLNYSVGGDYQLRSIKKMEFGYFYLNNGTIDDHIAFDNKIDIEVAGFSVRGDVTCGNRSDTHQFRISTIVSPSSNLDVEQKTDFKPIVTTSGTGDSSKSQDLGYLLSFESKHRFWESINLRFFFQYESLPMEYDLKVLASTATSFQQATIDVTEVTTRFGMRFVFTSLPIADGLYAAVGLSTEDVKTTNNVGPGSESSSDSLVSVGFAGQF
jgi:hypothetical protein